MPSWTKKCKICSKKFIALNANQKSCARPACMDELRKQRWKRRDGYKDIREKALAQLRAFRHA